MRSDIWTLLGPTNEGVINAEWKGWREELEGGGSYEERKENQKEKGHRRVLNISSETLNRVEGEGGWEKG